MNKLNIAATGFPATTETWKFIAKAYEDIFKGIALLISNSTEPVVFNGVIVNPTGITDGYIYYLGEILPFVGSSTVTDTIVIIEDRVDVNYNTDINNSGQLERHDTYITRYVKCGQPGEGVAEFQRASLVRIDNIKKLHDLTRKATESTYGIAKIATQQQTNEGTDDSRYVTPLKLKIKLDNMPYRIVSRHKINNASVNFGDIYSNHEDINLTNNIDPDNYIVMATFNDNSLTSAQPLLFSLHTQKANDHFTINWVLDARALTGNGTVSGWIDIIVIYIGG